MDLPVTGKDTRVQVLIGGALVVTASEVTGFEDKDENETIVTLPLGTSQRRIDKIAQGHSGTITFANSDPDLEDIRDAINLANKNRVKIVINIRRTISYRGGQSRAHTYADVKVDFSSSDSRGEARAVTMAWETGEARVPVAA